MGDKTADTRQNSSSTPRKQRVAAAVGPRLKRLLWLVFALFALISINSLYLLAVRLLEKITGESWQNSVYLNMFLLHLLVGLLLVVPVIVYGLIHFRNTRHRPNRRAVQAGLALFFSAIAVLLTGILLTRGIPWLELKHPQARTLAYWLHVILTGGVIWLFIMHRLAGRRINWKPGQWSVAAAVVLTAVFLWLSKPLPAVPDDGREYSDKFYPALSKTAGDQYIPAEVLNDSDFCQECHQDAHTGWKNSVHHLSSFNNPSYTFAVNNTREFLLKRDGNVNAARFCAACHDPVVLFSGEFDKPDVNFEETAIGQAGITCTSCHAIAAIHTIKGNGGYTLVPPVNYPFSKSETPWLAWIGKTLIKAKPQLHKTTYLKPLHKTAEFCSTCHKVGLPVELNGYHWLRGQDHYDSFFLSGVSGHAVNSFYYPKQAKQRCAQCHMPEQPSNDFGAFSPSLDDTTRIHSHWFTAANTAVRQLAGLKNEPGRDMLTNAVTIDLFGLRRQGQLTGQLVPAVAEQGQQKQLNVQAGKKYLLETVLRTRTPGHWFTQGTADSNQIWVELKLYHNDQLVAINGGLNEEGVLDDWAYKVNAYVIDKDGNRVDRRNAEDMFTMLYNHQIPPGAAALIHYAIDVPEDASGQLRLEAALHYRKFDTRYYRLFSHDPDRSNDLPITTMARDTLVLNIQNTNAVDTAAGDATATSADVTEITAAKTSASIPEDQWSRWNDYAIGAMRSGAFRQAEEALKPLVSDGPSKGRPLAWMNLVRSYFQQGRLAEAGQALVEAAASGHPWPWQLDFFSGQIDWQNGYLDKTVADFQSVYDSAYPPAQQARFDFSKDYAFVTRFAQAVFQQSKTRRGEARQQALTKARDLYQEVLRMNPEWPDAHYGISQVYAALGEADKAAQHRALHQKYKVDDNARDRAIALARSKDPAADHAANPIAIYRLWPAQEWKTVDAYRQKITNGQDVSKTTLQPATKQTKP